MIECAVLFLIIGVLVGAALVALMSKRKNAGDRR